MVLHSQPRVSVVIPTLNRSVVLCETLESLLSITPLDGSVEIIIVDQSGEIPNECAEKLNSWTNQGLIQHHRVKFRGTTKARNYGARHSQGNVIIYLDDDVFTPPGFIEAHLQAYEDKTLAGVAGCVLHEGECLLTKDDLSWRQKRELHAGSLVLFNAAFPYIIRWARGCNMSFRRDWIMSVGGFDENFYGVAVGEEPEFCHRLRQSSGIILFVPETRLMHRAVASGGSRNEARQQESFVAFADNACYYWLCVEPRWTIRLVRLSSLAFSILVNRNSMTSDLWPRQIYWFFSGLKQACHRFSNRAIAAANARLDYDAPLSTPPHHP